VFIFYKLYFEGEEMAPDFPLRGKEDGENERAMSSSGGGSGGGTAWRRRKHGNGDTKETTKGSRRRNSWILTPLKIEKWTRVISTGGGWLEAGGLKVREVGVGGIRKVDVAGGE
jgi:hypothetical protein